MNETNLGPLKSMHTARDVVGLTQGYLGEWLKNDRGDGIVLVPGLRAPGGDQGRSRGLAWEIFRIRIAE